MQFPMNRADRIALIAIADDLSALERRSAGLGLDFLALLISHAGEEAHDRLQDDIWARIENRAPVDSGPVSGGPGSQRGA